MIDHARRGQVSHPQLFGQRRIDVDIDFHRFETGRDDGDRLRIGERLFMERHAGVAPRSAKHDQDWPPADGGSGLGLIQRRMPGNGCLGRRRYARHRQEGNDCDRHDATGGVEIQTTHGDVAPRA